MRAVLHVCTTCREVATKPDPATDPATGRVPGPVPDRVPDTVPVPVTDPAAPRPGALLHAALADAAPEGVKIRGVECLSACSQGCSVALSGTGKWTYVYGRLTPADFADILAGAQAYAASADGLVPWRDRPAIFRKQSLARIPPHIPAQE